MPIKVGMVSLGCSKNLVDSERMLYKLRERGYELVTEPGLADVAVVNTCGFIQSAKEEAIETIIELGKLKEDGTLKKIIITGCLTQRYQHHLQVQARFFRSVQGDESYAESRHSSHYLQVVRHISSEHLLSSVPVPTDDS